MTRGVFWTLIALMVALGALCAEHVLAVKTVEVEVPPATQCWVHLQSVGVGA